MWPRFRETAVLHRGESGNVVAYHPGIRRAFHPLCDATFKLHFAQAERSRSANGEYAAATATSVTRKDAAFRHQRLLRQSPRSMDAHGAIKQANNTCLGHPLGHGWRSLCYAPAGPARRAGFLLQFSFCLAVTFGDTALPEVPRVSPRTQSALTSTNRNSPGRKGLNSTLGPTRPTPADPAPPSCDPHLQVGHLCNNWHLQGSISNFCHRNCTKSQGIILIKFSQSLDP